MNDKKKEDGEKIHFKKYIVKGYNKHIPDELEFKQFIIGSNNSNQNDKGIVYKHFTAKNSDNPLSYINDRYFKTYQVGQIEPKVPSLVHNKIDQKDTPQEFDGLINTYIEENHNELKNSLTIKNTQREITYDNVDFRKKLKEKIKIVAMNILNRYNLKSLDNKKLIKFALNLFDYAVSHKAFKPVKLGRQKGANFLSIYLVYFALISFGIASLGGNRINAKSIAIAVDHNYNALGFGSDWFLKDLSPNKLYNYLPNNVKLIVDNVPRRYGTMFVTTYKADLKEILEILALKVINKYSLNISLADLVEKGLDLFKYALTYKNLKPEHLTFKKTNQLSIILVYYALISLKIRKIHGKPLTAKAIRSSIGQDFKIMKFRTKNTFERPYINEFFPFLPDGVKNLAEEIPSYVKIIYDQDFKIVLEEKINSSVSEIIIRLKLSDTDAQNLQQIAMDLFESAIENGLRPEDLGEFKSATDLSIILLYYALLKYQLTGVLEKRVTGIDLGEYLSDTLDLRSERKKFGLSKFFSFLPQDYGISIDRIILPFKLTYNEVKRKIESLGYIMITSSPAFNVRVEKDDTYPSQTFIEVRCPRRHRFESSYDHLKRYGCPKCSENKYERICRWYVYRILSYIFEDDIMFKKTPLKIIDDIIKISYSNNYIKKFISLAHFDGYTELRAEKININMKKMKKFQKNIYAQQYKISNLETSVIDAMSNQFYNDFIENKLFKTNDIILIELPFGFIELKLDGNTIELTKSVLIRPQLRNDLTKLKLALESNGGQHYIFPNYYHKNDCDLALFLRQIINDLLKKKIVNDAGIFLILFPYWVDFYMKDPEKIQNFLLNEIENQLGISLLSFQIPQFNHYSKEFLSFELDLNTNNLDNFL